MVENEARVAAPLQRNGYVGLIASAWLAGLLLGPSRGVAQSLGTAQSFAVLAGSAITDTGPTTINGDLGVYMATSTPSRSPTITATIAVVGPTGTPSNTATLTPTATGTLTATVTAKLTPGVTGTITATPFAPIPLVSTPTGPAGLAMIGMFAAAAAWALRRRSAA